MAKLPEILINKDTGTKYGLVDEWTTLWPVRKVYQYACTKPIKAGDMRLITVSEKTWNIQFRKPENKSEGE